MSAIAGLDRSRAQGAISAFGLPARRRRESLSRSHEIAPDKENAVATDENKRLQDQVLDAIKQSQDTALEAVSAWSETVAKLAPKLPDVPTLPLADSLPDPGELSDQFFEFAQQLLISQQKFVQQLIAALPRQDTPSP
jgi:hypothetical protein